MKTRKVWLGVLVCCVILVGGFCLRTAFVVYEFGESQIQVIQQMSGDMADSLPSSKAPVTAKVRHNQPRPKSAGRGRRG